MFLPSLLVHLGEAYALADQPEEALSIAERVLALARERGQRGSEAWALRLIGEIASNHEVPTDRNRRSPLWQALTLAESSACARSSPTATSASASCTDVQGTTEPAASISTAATTLYREMDMRFWGEA